MYLNEAGSESVGYDGYNTYGPDKWSIQRPPAPPTSIPLDDNFDAVTTDAPTEWNMGRTRHRDYEESVSGLRNYVVDMERKLSGEDDYYVPPPKPLSRRPSYADSSLKSGRPSGSRKGLANVPMPENTRKVSGQRGKIELVEQKIMEDGPTRTISLWRERVAQSSAGGSSQTEDTHSESNSHSHRRMRSDGSYARRGTGPGHSGSGDSSTRYDAARKEMSLQRSAARASYERSEYMVAYHQTSKHGYPIPVYPHSEVGSMADKRSFASPQTSPKLPRMPSEAPRSPTIRRTSSRHLGDRSEYMISYSHAPQQSLGSVTSMRYKTMEPPSPMSPVQRIAAAAPRSNEASSVMKATSTSSVELILSSCDPPLLHIAPVLHKLGIQRLEHLRAIGRLSEETRDREIKEQALKRGVTMVEWAILLDKLQSL